MNFPPGGRNPCAVNAPDAIAILEQFLVAGEPRPTGQVGNVPSGRVHELQFTYQIELEHQPEQFSNRGLPHLRMWYVARCDRFEYLNVSFGSYVYAGKADPFGDLLVDDPDELKLAKVRNPLHTLAEFEELVDFFYRIERVPLRGFNQEGEFIGRRSLSSEGTFIVEDSVSWTIFDDAVPPTGSVGPPTTLRLVHVFIYDHHSFEVAHYAFVISDSPSDEGKTTLTLPAPGLVAHRVPAGRLTASPRPHAAILLPGKGQRFGRGSRRTMSLRGAAAHSREILDTKDMRWYSDEHGLLARGPRREVDLSMFSAGEHTIRFEVCGSDDTCTRDSVRIVVD